MSHVRKRILVEKLSVVTNVTINASSLTNKDPEPRTLINIVIISYFINKILHTISDNVFFCMSDFEKKHIYSDRKHKHKLVSKSILNILTVRHPPFQTKMVKLCRK